MENNTPNAMAGDPRYNSTSAYDNADLRVNDQKTKELIRKIQLDLIEEATNKIRTGVDAITNNMDSYWTGDGAKGFKNYLDSKTRSVIYELTKLKTEIETTIYKSASASSDADYAARKYFDSLGGN